MEREGMEELVFCYDPSSGLKAIIAIHNTALGPALGGCRCWSYTSEEEAIRDAIKLAKGMTYKNAMAGLPYGGGKAVIWDASEASGKIQAGSGTNDQNDDQVPQPGVGANLPGVGGIGMHDQVPQPGVETILPGVSGLGMHDQVPQPGVEANLSGVGKLEQHDQVPQPGVEANLSGVGKLGQHDQGTQTGVEANLSGVGGHAGEVLDVRALRFRALGRCLERLNGRFVTGLDLGTTASDMDQIRVETAYVTDTTGSLGAKDDFTADMTAYGVYIGIVTSLCHQGVAALQGISVAVQGLGKVGYALCRYLHAAGARLIVADVVPGRVQRALMQFSGAISADPARIHAADCMVFAPCALGGVITPATVEELRCSIVAGAANNQLHGGQLVARRMQAHGILYAPDYVLNAGGIISTACELQGAGPDLIRQKVAGIAGTLGKVYAEAARSGTSTLEAADRLAEVILSTGQASQ
ncbi:Leu/Phe/Val dehydrogenase [Paenibacillus silvae]|uniref:Leu/Phe/Val dehydrogenase n=1 Tax=Paenibacillus silvae TaxID=1325358 RepID=UPI003F4EBD99